MPKAQLPPALMFQGTASNAGKSILTAGLCRSLYRAGLNVAPFKAQNMSLNSWVADGLELGVAQALQARAAGLTPDARMNPVLLKPLGARNSQVIVLGKPLGIMSYEAYTRLKPKIWRQICGAYRELAADREVMILEGAGSPAEINLRKHDVVNMRMAAFAGAQVLLVADIDLGGAFASLVGTVALLSPRDRKRIRAFVLNKFRGDAALLTPALETISRRWRRPFAGIVPLLNLRLPQEDSACLSIGANPAPPHCLDLAIIALPAMSNLADFEPLLAEPQVHCRLVGDASQLGRPHAVLIPGSRHVPAALEYLHASGLAAAIREYARSGEVVGLCAGLQILGEKLADPSGVEGGGEHACLGLLPLRSTLGEDKILCRAQATILPPLASRPTPCLGNEIHHGRQETYLPPVIVGPEGKPLGWMQGKVWGTWLHGVFDADAFRHQWLRRLAKGYGLPAPPCVTYDLDAELDKLADALEKHLDMELIYGLLGQRG